MNELSRGETAVATDNGVVEDSAPDSKKRRRDEAEIIAEQEAMVKQLAELSSEYENHPMYTFATQNIFCVKQKYAEEFRLYMDKYMRDCRNEYGCLFYDMYRQEPLSVDSNESSFVRFMNVTKWIDKDCYDNHLDSPHVKQVMEYSLTNGHLIGFPVVMLLKKENGIHPESPVHRRILTDTLGLSQIMGDRILIGQPQGKGKSYTMCRYRTVKPNCSHHVVMQVLSIVASKALECEQNCISYDIFTSLSADTKNSIIEIASWNSRSDYLEHLQTPYVRQIDCLQSVFECTHGKDVETFWEDMND